MKALILAGGFGTRLRPLSCTRPKLMFPVANKPILAWTLNGLAEHGVEEVVLAVNYMAEALERRFGEKWNGMKITYSQERKPLGTAGPLKNAQGILGDDEPFYVLNGDILSSIDYRELHRRHSAAGGSVTVALHEVEDPSRFGVVRLDDEGRVLEFVEKPKAGEEPSKLINAGVYVVDPDVLKLIPEGKKASIEREIFPVLAEEGRLFGHVFEGLWVDVGKPDDYIRANRLMLSREAESKPLMGSSTTVASNATIKHPVVIGDGAVIGEMVHVGPYVAVGERAEIQNGSRVEDSILFDDVCIGAFSSVNGAIIGENAVIGKWVKIERDAVVGDHAVIGDNVTLTHNVSVCPYKEVDESILEPRQVR